MTYRFPSSEWIKELSRQLNASEAYERSARDWEGDIVFVVEPDKSYEGTANLFLGLYHGKSPDAEMTAPTCNGWGGFVLSAHHDVLTFVQCWAILTQTRRRLAACCGA